MVCQSYSASAVVESPAFASRRESTFDPKKVCPQEDQRFYDCLWSDRGLTSEEQVMQCWDCADAFIVFALTDEPCDEYEQVVYSTIRECPCCGDCGLEIQNYADCLAPQACPPLNCLDSSGDTLQILLSSLLMSFVVLLWSIL